MEKRLLFHIGYHKTATTWMQTQLFVPEHGYRQIAGHEEVFAHIVNPHELRFNPGPMQKQIAEGWGGLSANETPVISSEILSGHPFFGGRESDLYAKRLKSIAPDAQILISIRAQLQILPSVYMQYLLRGGTMPPSRFFRDMNDLGFFSFSSEHFEYDRLIALYQRLFGAENVHIITQESLRVDMDSAVAKLARFCDNQAFQGLILTARTVHPPSYPEHAAPVLRFINHIQKSTLNPAPILNLGETPRGLYRTFGRLLKHPLLSAILKNRRPVSEYVRTRFTGRFAESNTRLTGLTNGKVDLSGYE